MIMKTFYYTVIIATFLSILMTGCKNDNSGQPVVSGKLIRKSGCLNEKSGSLLMMTPDTLSCAEYFFYPSTNKLLIDHYNAGFNCCPGDIGCNFSLDHDTIIIREFETDQPCRCNCMYNLEIELSGIESTSYQIKFVEPYCGDQEKLIFGVDLSVVTQGSYCVIRKEYPWGE